MNAQQQCRGHTASFRKRAKGPLGFSCASRFSPPCVKSSRHGKKEPNDGSIDVGRRRKNETFRVQPCHHQEHVRTPGLVHFSQRYGPPKPSKPATPPPPAIATDRTLLLLYLQGINSPVLLRGVPENGARHRQGTTRRQRRAMVAGTQPFWRLPRPRRDAYLLEEARELVGYLQHLPYEGYHFVLQHRRRESRLRNPDS